LVWCCFVRRRRRSRSRSRKRKGCEGASEEER